jgi:fatty-acyl-CoA synthase
MSSEEVIEFCKENLASFKKPKVVHFVDALPKTPIGKILRSNLKKKYSEEINVKI